jgi:hypothetical protein
MLFLEILKYLIKIILKALIITQKYFHLLKLKNLKKKKEMKEMKIKSIISFKC